MSHYILSGKKNIGKINKNLPYLYNLPNSINISIISLYMKNIKMYLT